MGAGGRNSVSKENLSPRVNSGEVTVEGGSAVHRVPEAYKEERGEEEEEEEVQAEGGRKV